MSNFFKQAFIMGLSITSSLHFAMDDTQPKNLKYFLTNATEKVLNIKVIYEIPTGYYDFTQIKSELVALKPAITTRLDCNDPIIFIEILPRKDAGWASEFEFHKEFEIPRTKRAFRLTDTECKSVDQAPSLQSLCLNALRAVPPAVLAEAIEQSEGLDPQQAFLLHPNPEQYKKLLEQKTKK